MSFIQPPKPVLPLSWPGLLVYTDEITTAMAYVLSYDNGMWQLSAHVAADLPNLTRPSASQPVEVDVAADLRRQPPGTTTVISSLLEG